MSFLSVCTKGDKIKIFILSLINHTTCNFVNAPRVCTEEYRVPGYPDMTIRVDDEVHVNCSGIHMDPKIFPEPEKFDPGRFSKEEKAKRHP